MQSALFCYKTLHFSQEQISCMPDRPPDAPSPDAPSPDAPSNLADSQRNHFTILDNP
ncbi:hypothetical protein QT998_19635 [Microcoleus sp. S1D4]